ncbi:hypothetical protein EZS27_036271 [termite gut metagenome]|uniref:Arm DNA-binding domain-containing protein n=1 Tax=termite gut metagenome TaxID=433724 RepID=A0A5J4PTE7_9ZZZZ
MKEISKRSTFAVLFYINKAKRKKNGLCLLMGRITIDAGIVQFRAHTEVNPQTWDAKAGRAVGKTKEAVTVHKTLDKLERQIRSHYFSIIWTGTFNKRMLHSLFVFLTFDFYPHESVFVRY